MILKNKSYCISRAFLADSDDLYNIVKILKALKQIIVEQTEVNSPQQTLN